MACLLLLSLPEVAVAQGPSGLLGTWRGAFVREGAVQLVDADIGARGDTLMMSMSSPDRPTGRIVTLVNRDAEGWIGIRTWNGVARLAFDSTQGELFGTVGDGTITLHLRRMAAWPRVEVTREEVTFPSGGVTIAASLVRPVGLPIRSAIVMIQGRGCGGREGMARWLETLAQYGVAGLATDKRGTGRSGGSCLHGSIADLTDDAIAAMELLRRSVAGDSIRYGYWGNSAGGWVSVRAAARTPVDFLINTVGPATSVRQQQHDNVAMVTDRLGLAPPDRTRMHRYVDSMFVRGPTRARFDDMMATVAWARDINLASQFFETSDIPTSVAGLDSLWVIHNDYDPGPDLARLRIPILAFYGGMDEVVPPASNVPLLQRLASEAGNREVRIVVVPDGNHGLTQAGGPQTFPDGPAYWRFPRTGGQVLDEVLAFLRGR